MERYLIEVEHDDNQDACELAIKTFLKSGSHFMTNANWGCLDDEHKAWIIVEMENKDEALLIVPPRYRNRAKITKIVNFSFKDEDQEKLMVHHS